MATSRRTSRFLRLAAAAAVSGLGVVVAPATGHAAPPATVAEAQQQITVLNGKLEPIVEQYNAAQIQLTKTRKQQQQASARAGALQGQLQAVSGKVRQMASSAYRSVPMGEFTTIMTSRSPQEFLDQLSALDAISLRRGTAIANLRQAKSQADKAQQAAKQAASQAAKLASQLQAKKSTIEQQVQQVQSMLSRLTAAERARIFDGGGGHSTTACSSLDLPTPPNARAATAISAALSKCGSTYIWGAAGPNAFDCSGLTMWAWAKAGVSLPHQSGEQYQQGTHVSQSQLLPGDLVFFGSPIHHVGMYVGAGMFVQAPNTGDVVKVTPLANFPEYAGATRVW